MALRSACYRPQAAARRVVVSHESRTRSEDVTALLVGCERWVKVFQFVGGGLLAAITSPARPWPYSAQSSPLSRSARRRTLPGRELARISA
jgi:hypothetical protein